MCAGNRSIYAISVLAVLMFPLAAAAQWHEGEARGPVMPDFVMDFTGADPADPPPPPTRTGETLHGLTRVTGTVLECASAFGEPNCPVFQFVSLVDDLGVDDNVFYVDEFGLGVIDSDYTSPVGCTHLGCATPITGDQKEAIDSGYVAAGDSREWMQLLRPAHYEFTEITFHDPLLREMEWVIDGCSRAFPFSAREMTAVFDPNPVGGGTVRRDIYVPPFGAFSGGLRGWVAIRGNNGDLVPTQNDGIRLVRMRAINVVVSEQPTWRLSCPIWGSVFDSGLNTTSQMSYYNWTVSGAGVGWRNSDNPNTGNLCGEPNYTEGNEVALCAVSEGQSGNFDTTATAGPIDLTGIVGARLRFRTNFQRRNQELLSVEASRSGANGPWENVLTIDSSQGLFKAVGGEEVDASLDSFVAEPEVHLRFRYWDPNGTFAEDGWYAQVDDVLIYELDAIFVNGFETGDTSGWSNVVP